MVEYITKGSIAVNQKKLGAGAAAPLDTLAQLGTTQKNPPSFDPGLDLPDSSFRLQSCTLLDDKTSLQKRARAKYLTSSLVIRLAALESPLAKSYWNSFHCASVIEKQGNKVTSTYCKNRWCIVCSRIRTALLIKKYRSTFESWGDCYHVVLTVPNCLSDDLKSTIDDMDKTIKRITEACKKRSQRKTGPALVAVKKLECTYNASSNSYHPHFHLIVKGHKSAHDLKREWLARYPACVDAAQHVSKADENAMLELFKYFTKIITKVKTGEKEQRKTINVETLDVIFRAIQGKRTFQSIGFKVNQCEELKDDEKDRDLFAKVDESSFYEWDSAVKDWVDRESGELLSEYEPTERMITLCESIPFKVAERVPGSPILRKMSLLKKGVDKVNKEFILLHSG